MSVEQHWRRSPPSPPPLFVLCCSPFLLLSFGQYVVLLIFSGFSPMAMATCLWEISACGFLQLLGVPVRHARVVQFIGTDLRDWSSSELFSSYRFTAYLSEWWLVVLKRDSSYRIHAILAFLLCSDLQWIGWLRMNYLFRLVSCRGSSAPHHLWGISVVHQHVQGDTAVEWRSHLFGSQRLSMAWAWGVLGLSACLAVDWS